MNYELMKYRIQRKLFRWVSDNDGDIGICIAGLVTLVKYKEMTIVHFGKCKFGDAEKWQGRKKEG